MPAKKYTSAISFLIIIATISFSFLSLMPQKVSDASTPLTQFSTERALLHLKEITKKPHYVGSLDHKNVKDYIVKQLQQLGLKTEIQHQVAINKTYRQSAVTQNILAKIKGTDSSKALLLLSHYDSAPSSSLGASDAGSGVVTILEGLRAFLANNKQPKNDIIILISDAEEIGLLGANAFVNYHPWAKNVGLVLNFEARGSGGPSYMLLETNGGNKNLIQQFRKANPDYPVATSLMYSIYKMLPNDTDLTIFREDGDIDGFNFALIDDHFDYHTAQDNYERLDRNTLEHQGTYLMPLLNYFADADLTSLKSDTDYVYFNMPIIGMVYYPFSWILPLLVIVILLFLGLVFYGISQHKIHIKQIFSGFIPFLLSLLISGLFAVYGWKLLKIFHPQYNDIQHGFTYNGHLYIAAFSALTLAISFLIYSKYFKKAKTTDLAIAPIFIWILINIAIAIYLKGAGYFIIAALYGITSLTILLFSKKHPQNNQLLLTLFSIPVLILFVPMIQMFPIGLGLKILIVSTTFIVLIFGLLIPIFSAYGNNKRLGQLFLVLAMIIFISASFKSGYNEDRKQPNSILYILDTDKNEAHWASYDKNIDEFTQQFLGENPTKGRFDSVTSSSKYGSSIRLHKKTDVKNIAQPVIDVISDTIINNDRIVHFSITSQRKANRIELFTKNDLSFKTFSVNGVNLAKKKGYDFVFETGLKKSKRVLSHYIIGDDESLKIKFSISKEEKLSLSLYEISFDLLESTLFNVEPLYYIKPRTNTMMPTPFVNNDAIIVKKQINF
ncbi:MAG: M28 family peptidase [Flavobacteriaceae bacterium]|nr:M28 family peptidase [Flavobacteriaceae bacterium]